MMEVPVKTRGLIKALPVPGELCARKGGGELIREANLARIDIAHAPGDVDLIL